MIKMLFVCVENSCRSQMAEGFARFYGKERIEAFSAGSRPSGTVNETAIEVRRLRNNQSTKALADLSKLIKKCNACPERYRH